MDLVGIAEIADLMGVTKQVVSNWRSRREDFPKPIAALKSGPVWSREAIVKWAERENLELAILESPKEDDLDPEASRYAIVAAFMNMKGGVGKSTMTANIGWYAAYRKDYRVLLVDLDPQFNLSQYILGTRGYERLLSEEAPTVQALFDKNQSPAPDINEIIQAVADWDDDSCIHLLPASLELAWTIRTAPDLPHMLKDSLEEIKSDYDLILIDCAPTESTLSTAAYLASDYVFVPVKPEFLATIGIPLLLRSLNEFQNTYKTEDVPKLGGIIFNDTTDSTEHRRSKKDVKKVASEHGWYVFSNSVSHSNSYPAGARVGKPIFLTDKARTWKKEEFTGVAQEFLHRVGLK